MRTKLLLAIGFVLVCLLAVATTAGGADLTYTVNTTADPGVGVCDFAECTLREALTAANGDGGASTIEFNIPFGDAGHEVNGISGTWTISPTTPLPCLSEAGTIISGTTQALFIGGDPNPYGPEIEISGASMTGNPLLCVVSADNVIHGLVINASPGYGFWIGNPASVGNTLSGNYIGTDAAGVSEIGNAWSGIYVVGGAHDNVIGGQTPAERNVISGNKNSGVEIYGTESVSNTVSGNYIGTDAAGASKIGNSWDGVRIWGGADYNIIGGQTPGRGNVISGNGWMGVDIWDGANDSNIICGNYIGTDATGTQPLGNTYHGVSIEWGGQNNVIGGNTDVERNVISANGLNGVRIAQTGTDGNTVSGNYIGTDANGTQDLGNGDSGVVIRYGAQDNTIGPNNVIAYNDPDGVLVTDSGTTGNTITQNSIHSNAGLGIELGVGGNDPVSAPSIGAANACFVMGTAGAGDTVEVFTGPDEEGKTFLASTSADGNGTWLALGSFNLDTYVTATAADASGNTSEFSLQATPLGCHRVFVPLVMKSY